MSVIQYNFIGIVFWWMTLIWYLYIDIIFTHLYTHLYHDASNTKNCVSDVANKDYNNEKWTTKSRGVPKLPSFSTSGRTIGRHRLTNCIEATSPPQTAMKNRCAILFHLFCSSVCGFCRGNATWMPLVYPVYTVIPVAFQWHSSVHWTSQCTLAQDESATFMLAAYS